MTDLRARKSKLKEHEKENVLDGCSIETFVDHFLLDGTTWYTLKNESIKKMREKEGFSVPQPAFCGIFSFEDLSVFGIRSPVELILLVLL